MSSVTITSEEEQDSVCFYNVVAKAYGKW